jgi:hypothetical protein
MTMEANGVYTFELHETLDHYDPTTADEDITLTFGLDVYDSAGDKTETSLRIRIKDDGNETETTDTLPSQGDGSQEATQIAVSQVIEEPKTPSPIQSEAFTEDSGYAVDGEQDMFLFQAVANEAAEIFDFNTQEGDAVDLSLLIEGESDVTEAIQDFVHVSETEEGDTVISVDVDGATGPAEAVEVAKLKDVTGESLGDLVDNGNIIV